MSHIFVTERGQEKFGERKQFTLANNIEDIDNESSATAMLCFVFSQLKPRIPHPERDR